MLLLAEEALATKSQAPTGLNLGQCGLGGTSPAVPHGCHTQSKDAYWLFSLGC